LRGCVDGGPRKAMEPPMHTDAHRWTAAEVTVTRYSRGSTKARQCNPKEADGGRSPRKAVSMRVPAALAVSIALSVS
jgi:hypothetical protein